MDTIKNKTTEYYNNNAETYFDKTVEGDFSELRERFASRLKAGSRIIDVGCGSGRDVAAFREMGFDAVGLDSSEKLAALAERKLGVKVIVSDMSTWVADEPYDGMWCFASLLHLSDKDIDLFFKNINSNLKNGGIIFISVKEGIITGFDNEGRYMRNFSEKELLLRLKSAGLDTIEVDRSVDQFGRDGFNWLNITAKMV